MASYNVMVRTFKAELETTEQFKRETIVKLAEQLEKEQYETNEINDRISDDLEGYISRGYIGSVLDDKYKNKSKVHRKKKLIELAADGNVIDMAAEEARINAIEHDKFTEALDKVAEAGSKEIESLDQAVLKELDQVRDERKELQERLNSAMNEIQKQKEFFDDVKNYFNEYIMVNEEYEIVEVMPKRSNEIKIDLRKFEDNIKDSYKRGKHVAEIRHNGTNVTSWK